MQLDTQTDLVPLAIREDSTVTASVHGEIDLHNSPELRTAILHVLIKPDVKLLKLNLKEVPYMDSSAIAVLVEGLRLIQRQKGEILLTYVQPRVRAILQIARLDTIFKMADEPAN